MLTRLKIENFKSFSSPATLDLAPLTLLAGANSSGKTTVIQSLLLLKQTLQYAPINTPIALNGPLLKLGDFRDISNVLSDKDAINIEWEMMLTKPINSRLPFFFSLLHDQTVTSLRTNCSIEFHVPEGKLLPPSQLDLANLHPQLKSARVHLEVHRSSAEKGHSLSSLYLSIESTPAEARDTSAIGTDVPSPSLSKPRFIVTAVDADTASQAIDGRSDGRIVGAGVSHFLPDELVVEFDEARDLARRAAQRIAEFGVSSSRTAKDVDTYVVPATVIYLIKEYLENRKDEDGVIAPYLPDYGGLPMKISDLQSAFRDFELENRRSFRGAFRTTRATPTRYATLLAGGLDLRALQSEIQNQLELETTSRLAKALVQAPHFNDYEMSIRYWMSYSVKYLGPLRDEPKPAYPLEALDNPRDVGYRGEHTAAVFHLFRDEQVEYVASSFVREPKLLPEVKTTTLYAAAIDWLSYMGVAEDISAGDEGKFGHTLQVRAPGIRKLHDLTNVGVGVSQVLPIVIQTLLADRGTLLIFEQPELHLHPRVQARLGDFFLAMSLHGKQCIVETHSEYMIDRVRRRIAEAPESRFNSAVEIYFLERSNAGTNCRRVKVSEFGAVSDWPRDFFDQSDEEAEAIIGAASKKRQHHRFRKESSTNSEADGSK